MKKVYLANKDGRIICHTDLAEMERLDGISKPELVVTIEEYETAGSTAHFNAAGKIVLGEPPEAKAKREEIETLTLEEKQLQSELDSKDYKVIKAAETGNVLSKLDPDLHERREECRRRINEVRDRLAELST